MVATGLDQPVCSEAARTPTLNSMMPITEATVEGPREGDCLAANGSYNVHSTLRNENAPSVLASAAPSSGGQITEDELRLSLYAARQRKREWVQDQLISARQSGQLQSDLEAHKPDEGFCWICARRGKFEFCPQVWSNDAKLRITIGDHVSAAFFAAEASNPAWKPENERLVFYTDMAAVSGTRHDPSIAGAGVTYRRILDKTGSDWFDALYGLIGTNRPDKSELYAIGLALKIAAAELRAILDESCGLGQQADAHRAPAVVLITDSQAALYYIHDFIWKGAIPSMFSKQTFLDLMHPLDRLRELGGPVDFHWVPSHTSVEGNCRADSLAGEASRWVLTKFQDRIYDTLLDCEVVRVRDTLPSALICHPNTVPDQTRRERSGPSKTNTYTMLAKQIEGLQAQWIADQKALEYRPINL